MMEKEVKTPLNVLAEEAHASREKLELGKVDMVFLGTGL